MPLSREALLIILQAALDEPLGLLIRTSDTTRCRAALYKARTDSGDARLSSLQIRMSPFPDGDLVICHPQQRSNSRYVPDLGELPD